MAVRVGPADTVGPGNMAECKPELILPASGMRQLAGPLRFHCDERGELQWTSGLTPTARQQTQVPKPHVA